MDRLQRWDLCSEKYRNYDFKKSHQRNMMTKDSFVIYLFKEALTDLFTTDLLISYSPGGYHIYHHTVFVFQALTQIVKRQIDAMIFA